MRRLIAHLRVRPRLMVAIATGIAAATLLPNSYSLITRSLLGWNVAVWLYLVLAGLMMLRADHTRLRQVAVAQAEAASIVLIIVILAALISLMGIVVELMAAKAPGAPHALPHVLFALATVTGSWLLLPVTFALTYASQYYRTAHGSGLNFPHVEKLFKPDYGDFLYFSFTIAVASQTADVSVTTQMMRRLVLLQSVLSFAFNTAILAFTINIAASLF
ncbi:MAG: DUF1345 domain-containing protein [Burkholderiaceae bacterium]|nr:DUF1345 domain-containing protein [Burkholderiaceae bacterium]